MYVRVCVCEYVSAHQTPLINIDEGGYIYEVIEEAFLEILYNGGLLYLDQQHHVLYPTGFFVTTLPMVCLE